MAEVLQAGVSTAVLVMALGFVWWLVIWVGGAFLAAWVASENDRSPLSWWLGAFILSPFLALLALVALPSLNSRSPAKAT
jgi:hypothetical protein